MFNKPSITTWIRLEPRSRDAEMSTTLQARVYDPLWMLARQWQVGEFLAPKSNLGSPVKASWRAEAARLTRYHLGAPEAKVNGESYDSKLIPLETLVERETIRPLEVPTEKPEKFRLAAEAGLHFLRMLDLQQLSSNYGNAFIGQYSFAALQPGVTLDSESQNYFDLISSRVPDGLQLYAAFRSAGDGKVFIDPLLKIAPNHLEAVEKIAQAWMQWFDALFSEPKPLDPTKPKIVESAWVAERMEYAFSIGARLNEGERVLAAQEYFGGRLDWYAFDANPEATIGAEADNAISEIPRTVIPAPVSFRGMPAARFWEFENAQVDLGSIDAGPADLGRMLLVEFALDYGNDWFLIPIELEIGSIYQTHSLVITDSFENRTLIRPIAADSPWKMFQHSSLRASGREGSVSNLFFLSPSLVKSLESRPIEEVLFMRDEMANLALGMERAIESSAENPLNRFETYLEKKRRHEEESPEEPTTVPGALRYRLTTEIPDYMIPLMPVREGEGHRLKRGAVLKTDGKIERVEALGHILQSGEELLLFEEEVPREGIRVTRSYQFTRWIDGSSHLWIGRDKGVGGGEGSSGLGFDKLDEKG